MFNRVSINNFQSHKHSVLNFHEGMNVIIGQSDSGKSAILRALRFVSDNRPGGDAFRSTWGGATFVKIELMENVSVMRTKSKKENSYRLSTYDEPFLAFGQDVPIEIQKALNIDDVNMQKQLDAPFLLSETSGNVATHFNKIAKLEQIDYSRNYIQSEINKITANIKQAKAIALEKTESLKTFDFLTPLKIELETVKQKKTINDAKKEKLNGISTILNSINEIEVKIQALSQVLVLEKPVLHLLDLFLKKENNKNEYLQLKALSLEIYYKDIARNNLQNLISAETGVNNILKQYNKQTEDTEFAKQLQLLYNRIERKEKALKTAKKQYVLLETDYIENYPTICPFCKSKVN